MSATNEMIERCISAIEAEAYEQEVFLPSREGFARAVLQTLMTPTDEMVEAGERAAWDHDNHMPAIRAMLAGWTAMLEQALEGEGK